ncbi:hypothetical protein [Mesorhizobium sp. M1B.F.Ca.ET.045.04.1.1]|uniref:ArnT family glycosyltransferase n=1 Tax=Mesorhizobium sp. M1B.F.Ca.ET.045.04.1.1 TaxID=2493673 RepID=UPI000F7532D0|nr:hypothetical protein [Mesorhizobium sp. M1B.F.Ca.ET.045.04.1.1]AZO29913.1 hypothetical protein EJ071_22620 [Mesorhizobium sp. M1B.F.Ca.ET.045.04.1.1]
MTSLDGFFDTRPEAPVRIDRWTILILFGTIAALELATALFREINWDEFHFLSLVFEYKRASLSLALQTFHVHLFSWLTLLPTDEIGAIAIARCLMWLLHLATLWFLFKTAESLVSIRGALWATVLYATLSFVMRSATSFRADPIITALLMGALFGLTRDRLPLRLLILSALAVTFAGLISIKAVFYVPTITMVAVLQLVRIHDKVLLRNMVIALAIAVAAFAILFLCHSASLAQVVSQAGNTLTSVYNKQLVDSNLFYGARFLAYSLAVDALQWSVICAGIGLAVARTITNSGAERLRALTILSFALPLLCVIFYRNSFPYFYVFMMAPVAVVGALAADKLGSLSKILGAIPVIFVALAVGHAIPEFQRGQSAQQSLISAVHQLFPDPVPYIAQTGMVASYPHAGFLMSTWGIEEYRDREEPVLLHAIEKERPLFVIVSGPALSAALEPGTVSIDADEGLLPADIAALKENYVRHWGPIWIAGKQLPATGGSEATFAIHIPGPYSVTADAPVEIDRRLVLPGDVVELAGGTHSYRGGVAALRRGRNLPVPAREPPTAIFTGF